MTDTMTRAEPGATAAPAATAVVPNRFINASAEHIEPFYDSGQVAAGTELNNIEVPANGYLSGVLVRVDVTSSGNSATVANAADAPFTLIQSIRMSDVNGSNLFGPLDGYSWYQAVKRGGYAYANDALLNPSYTALTTGAGATAGTGSFIMRLPVQINPRDAYGSLPNMNAASTFKLGFTLASLASAFSTPPNGTVTVRIRLGMENWLSPQAVDGNGVPNMLTPPGLGSYQRWVKNSFNVASGSNQLRLPNVSNMIRNLVMIWRASGARTNTNFPSTVDLRIDGYTRDQIRSDEIRTRMWERTGETTQDAGVYAWDWTHELDGKLGFETRELWLPTNSATRLELVGDFGGAGTLDVLTNDVITVGDPRQAG